MKIHTTQAQAEVEVVKDIKVGVKKYKVCKYFDDIYEKTIAKGLTKEEAKQIRDEANTEYGHNYTSYEIKEEKETLSA